MGSRGPRALPGSPSLQRYRLVAHNVFVSTDVGGYDERPTETPVYTRVLRVRTVSVVGRNVVKITRRNFDHDGTNTIGVIRTFSIAQSSSSRRPCDRSRFGEERSIMTNILLVRNRHRTRRLLNADICIRMPTFCDSHRSPTRNMREKIRSTSGATRVQILRVLQLLIANKVVAPSKITYYQYLD